MKSYSMPNSELKVKAITFKFMFRPDIIYTIRYSKNECYTIKEK